MAVIVDIPGVGQVEAKNAATEATLRELVSIMKKGGSGGAAGGAGAALSRPAGAVLDRPSECCHRGSRSRP